MSSMLSQRASFKDAFHAHVPSDDIDHVATLINNTLDRLKRLIDNLRQISTDIAHDLRTPISRMRQKLEVVQNSSPDIATYRAAVDETIEEKSTALPIPSTHCSGFLRSKRARAKKSSYQSN